METTELEIGGMSCGHCVAAVRSALDDLDGVRVDEVQIGSATVAYDPQTVGTDRIRSAVEAAGYTVRSERGGA